MNGQIVIYLADLVHNHIGKGPFMFPINLGYISSYTNTKFGDNVEIKIFKFPADLLDAIKKQKPDVVGLGNYTWNLDLNIKILDHIKSISKDILTVMGGPDYPSDYYEAAEYLKERKSLDFYVLFQGEIGFVNILNKLLEKGSIERIKQGVIENCVYYDFAINKVVIGKVNSLGKDLDIVPSPYLTGIMDQFFEGSCIPIIETNRGCPYTCTYCAWGNSARRFISEFSLDRVTKEIEYISKKVRNTDLLSIADANFGIFKKDVEIAKFIKEIHDKTGYPRYLDVAFAKNAPDRIIKIAEILGDMISVTTSFQSLNPQVLENIKRPNMAVDHYIKVQQHFNSKKIQSYSELILGLPGETKKSHEDAIRHLFDFNTSSIVCYNLRMLGGAELNTPAQRKKYGIKTKFRLIDNGFGEYSDILSIECEEMVLGTNTMSQEDIIYFRAIHWLVQFMWNYKYYVELLHYLKGLDINPLDFIAQILKSKDLAPAKVKNLIDNFIKDSYLEWSDSKEELVKYYSNAENFKSIITGGFGKLNYKYTYKVLIECKEDFDNYLYAVALNLLNQDGNNDAENILILKDIFTFMKYSCIDFKKRLSSINEKNLEFSYDIMNWKNNIYSKKLNEYKSKIVYKFYLPDSQLTALNKIYHQFEQDDLNLTLRKMVEYMKIKDLFYQVNYNGNDTEEKS